MNNFSGHISLPHNFSARFYQKPVLEALDKGAKRVIFMAHRRAGKDVTALNYMIKKMWEEVGVYFYIFPTYRQGRRAIWDSITNAGQAFMDFFPECLVDKKNDTDMKIKLVNGSIFQIVGSDNYNDLMGTNPRGVVLSEYALQDPMAWEFIKPILKLNGGWALFVTTPRGKNHFYRLWQQAYSDPNWFCYRVTIEDSDLLTDADLDQERREGMSEELIQQEYYCSFNVGIDGTYFGRYVDEMNKQGRIGNVPYDKSADVHTYWDIGIGDATSIIFAQKVGSEHHIIDYYENQGEGIEHYMKVLQDKGYVYGRHWAPHDIEARSFDLGMTSRAYAKSLGLHFNVVEKTQFNFGIECARSVFNGLWIDEHRCRRLIECLENYHKTYNSKLDVYSDAPCHDAFSHGCDAFRYFAIVQHKHSHGGMTADQLRSIRAKAMYGNNALPYPFGVNQLTGQNPVSLFTGSSIWQG